jgi:GNAT superfamily N-acetyltransferase
LLPKANSELRSIMKAHRQMPKNLQRSFTADPSLSDRLFDLLTVVFPDLELRQLAQVGRDLGAPWELASVPFAKFASSSTLNPPMIAHVGVLELPLQVMGQRVKVGGIHAVASHPDFRRQGHYRGCMAAALEYCDARYQTLVLTTSQPELYQPFGFRVVPEYRFVVPCQPKGDQNRLRILDLQAEGDRALLHRLLDRRIPVSNMLGVYPEKAVFFVNEASRPLYYAPDLEALIVIEIRDHTLHLFDVVCERSVSLANILQCLPEPIAAAVIYFSPDLLEVDAQAVPTNDDDYLMVRGSFAAAGQPIMLPRSARC